VEVTPQSIRIRKVSCVFKTFRGGHVLGRGGCCGCGECQGGSIVSRAGLTRAIITYWRGICVSE
jgi:hypothetical protein